MKTPIVVLTVLMCLPMTAYAQEQASVRQLVRQADFVGVVEAEPLVVDSKGEWKQDMLLTSAEGIKGGLSRNFGNNQYPWIKADHAGHAGYPTRFGERGEYLVFLHKTGTGSAERWTTLVAYRIQYYPDIPGEAFSPTGSDVIGIIENSPAILPPPSRTTLTISEVRLWLDRLTLGRPLFQRDQDRMDAFFRASLLTNEAAHNLSLPTHEERLALATELAEAVTPGTTRAQVEKIFPQSDGGAVGSDRGRYYFGSEVMIDVPYDTNGGPFAPDNKVAGPLRVYRDMMHLD